MPTSTATTCVQPLERTPTVLPAITPPANPLSTRVLRACAALKAAGVYPSVKKIQFRTGGRYEAVLAARQRLVAAGLLSLSPSRWAVLAGPEEARRRPGVDDPEEVSRNIQFSRLGKGAGQARLAILNPGPYAVNQVRGPLLTHLLGRMAKGAGRRGS